ncbi:hypothetical protein ACFL6S_12825 [Candidatus Poribacteria bacterium]
MRIYMIGLIAIFCICYARTGFALEESNRVVYSVKVIKKEPKMSLTTPLIRILDNQEDWQKLNESDDRWQGENLWEVYLNIATGQEEPDMPRVEIAFQGVEPVRAIVGNSDVPYKYEDGKVSFTMRDDRSVGQLIETYWKDPRGGLPIHLRHNWEMRKVGPWDPWPASAICAVDNFLFAAREALRLINKDNPDKDRFDGRIVLMGFETSSSRGHKDDPAHVHIMLYVPGYSPGSCVPHLYVNDDGRVYSNSYVRIGVAGSGRNFGPGEICSMEDLGDNVGLEVMITEDGGLLLRAGPGADNYYLRPHEGGGHVGVSVYREDDHICDVSTVDKVSVGSMVAEIEYAKETWTEEILYDPFTGRLHQD